MIEKVYVNYLKQQAKDIDWSYTQEEYLKRLVKCNGSWLKVPNVEGAFTTLVIGSTIYHNHLKHVGRTLKLDVVLGDIGSLDSKSFSIESPELERVQP